MVDSEVVQIQWERARPGLAKDPTRGFQHGERCCWKAGKILLSMGALLKDPRPPKLETWVSKQPLTIIPFVELQTSVCGPDSSPGMVGRDKCPTSQAPRAQTTRQR